MATCALCNKNQATFNRFVPKLGRNAPICAACLPKLGGQTVTFSTQIPVSSLFKKLFADFDNIEFMDYYSESPRFVTRSVICSNCGFDLASYSKQGRLGCSKCYDTFQDNLLPIIGKIHGCTKRAEGAT